MLDAGPEADGALIGSCLTDVNTAARLRNPVHRHDFRKGLGAPGREEMTIADDCGVVEKASMNFKVIFVADICIR